VKKLLSVDAVAEDARARLLRRLERELAQGWPPPYRVSDVRLEQRRLERQQFAEELALEAVGLEPAGRAGKSWRRRHLSVVA